MKRIRKLISMLLALALAAGLALPAAAEETPDPSIPVITVQPQDVYAVPGEQFTISVEAYIPNGDTVGYWWMDARTNSNLGKLGPALTRTAGDPVRGEYYCVVYNASVDFIPQAARSVESEHAVVSHTPLTAEETPVITLQPQSETVPCGMQFTLAVAAQCPNGDPVGYQWRGPGIGGSSYTVYSTMTDPVFSWKANKNPDHTERIYCVVYNAAKGLAAGGVDSAQAVVTTRLPTAREIIGDTKDIINSLPSIREGLKQDPLHLINGAFAYVSMVAQIIAYWVLDLFKVAPERLDAASSWFFFPAMAVLVPVMLIYVLVFALPVSLVMLPFSMS